MHEVTLEIRDEAGAEGTLNIRLLEHLDDGTRVERSTHALAMPAWTLDGQPASFEAVRDVCLATNSDSNRFAEVGGQLRALLLAGATGVEYLKLRAASQPIRTYLDVRTKLVAGVPFELLQIDNLPAFLVANAPVTRWVSTPATLETPPTWPLRLLVVIGAEDSDPNVLAPAERAAIEQAVRPANRTIDLDVLVRPTQKALKDALETFCPHIVHFIGHGGLNANGDPQLRFEADPAPGWGWTAEDIRLDLDEVQWRPMLACLNACRTRKAPGSTVSDRDSMRSIADAFHASGTPAVIAMQADVYGRAAGVLAGTFYAALTEGAPMDQALTHARLAVSREPGFGRRRREPYVATLSVARRPEDILPLAPLEPAEMKRLRDVTAFNVVSDFVDRRDDRRKVFRSFYPFNAKEKALPYSVVVVRGGDEAGKSALVCWCLEGCARRRHLVRYVDVSKAMGYVPVPGSLGGNWLDVLRVIRDGPKVGGSRELIDQPLDPRAFDEFNRNLNLWLAGRAVPENLALAKAPPTSDDMAPYQVMAEHMEKAVVEAFCRALKEIAAKEPLTLVLDHFEDRNDGTVRLTRSQFEPLLQNLIAPIGDGRPPGLRLLLVLTNEQYTTTYELDRYKSVTAAVTLEDLPQKEFEPLALEFLRLRYGSLVDVDDTVEKMVRKRVATWPIQWKLPELRAYRKQVAGVFGWD